MRSITRKRVAFFIQISDVLKLYKFLNREGDMSLFMSLFSTRSNKNRPLLHDNFVGVDPCIHPLTDILLVLCPLISPAYFNRTVPFFLLLVADFFFKHPSPFCIDREPYDRIGYLLLFNLLAESFFQMLSASFISLSVKPYPFFRIWSLVVFRISSMLFFSRIIWSI